MFQELEDFDFDCDFDEILPPKKAAEEQNILVPNVNETRFKTHLKTNNHVQPPSRPPQKSRTVLKRKFGGPAGLLPEIDNVDKVPAVLEQEVAPSQGILNLDMVCSQLSTNAFLEPPWQQMCKELSTMPGQFFPDIYNIAWIEAKANAQKLVNQKAPFLAAIISNIEVSNAYHYVSLMLKDPTGEIQGYIMLDLYKEYSSVLTKDSVIVLKDVGVLTAEHRKHYLNITIKNMVTIYSKQVDIQEEAEVNNRTQNNIIVRTISIQKIPNQCEDIKPIQNKLFDDFGDLSNFVDDDILLNVSLKYEKMISPPREREISIPNRKHISDAFEELPSTPHGSDITVPSIIKEEIPSQAVTFEQMTSTPHRSDITIPCSIEKKRNNTKEASVLQFKQKQIPSKPVTFEQMTSTPTGSCVEKKNNSSKETDNEQYKRKQQTPPDASNAVQEKRSSLFGKLKRFKFEPRTVEAKPLFNFSEEDTSRSEFSKILSEKSTSVSKNLKSVNNSGKENFFDLENSKIQSTPVFSEAVPDNSQSIVDSQSSFMIRGSQITITCCDTKDKSILEDAFSGVDVDSLFDDF